MDKAEYISIRDQLSFKKYVWVSVAVIVLDLGLLLLVFHLLNGGLAAFILSQLILSIFYFHNFALLHEAGHGNVSSNRWINHAVGLYASVFCFLPYFPWKYIHKEHHIWTGNIDKDPTMEKLKEVREKQHIPWLFDFAWRSWVPLAALSQQGVFWRYPITLIRRGGMSPKVFYQSVFSVVWMVAIYGLLYWLFPDTVNIGNIWLSYVFYLMLTELINFPHHIQMPTFHTSPERSRLKVWEQHVTTRSCDYGWLSPILALNFNYHIEHHYFPHLPWYRLKKLRKILKPALGDEYTGLRGIGWNITNRAKKGDQILLPETPHPLLQK